MYPALWQMDTVIPEQLCVLIPYITTLSHIITNTRNHFCHIIIELSVCFVGVPRLFGQMPHLSWQYHWPDKAHVGPWVPIHIFPFVAILRLFFSRMNNEDVGWLPVVFCQRSRRMNTSEWSYVWEAYALNLALPLVSCPPNWSPVGYQVATRGHHADALSGACSKKEVESIGECS